jgi:polysaccharide biosynthesis protein PslJ
VQQVRAGPAHRALPLAIASLGAATMLVTLTFGPRLALAGAVFFALACLVAIREASTPVITWPSAIAGLMLVIWLIPIRSYRLPIDLPFNLEAYRLLLLLLVFVWVVAAVTGAAAWSAGGHGKPLFLLTAFTIATQVLNYQEIDAATGEPTALKSLSYFLSFILVFLLLCSALKSLDEIDLVARSLVIGGMVVGAAALYEASSAYNLFDHLHQWVPVLVREEREVLELRGGRLRVYGSAQHPIALGCALLMMVPLALYLVRRARTAFRGRLWVVAGLFCGAGALATVSRTTIVMGVSMAALALYLRPKEVVRFWPVLLILPFLVHFAAPGALGGIYKSFFPDRLTTELTERAGQSGSGRLSDLRPGIELWEEKPALGHGLGSLAVPGQQQQQQGRAAGPTLTEIIFDNQYVNTLVTQGALGLFATIWFVWGAVLKLARAAALRRLTLPGDLIAACAVSALGFAASMLLFDAFFFVQATIVFFALCALGLRARELDPVSALRPSAP